MKGTILHFDREAQNGIIRAEDGLRYGFAAVDLKSTQQPRVGETVDFEIVEGVATDIYSLREPAAISLDMNSIRQSISEGTSKAAKLARDLGSATNESLSAQKGSTVLSPLLGDWRVPLSALALLACLFPFISFGFTSTNLFGVVSNASAVRAELNGIQQLVSPMNKQAFNPWIGGSQFTNAPQQAKDNNPLFTLTFGLQAVWLLYAIPGLVYVLVQAFRRRQTRTPALWLGLTCAAMLPIAIIGSIVLSSYQAQFPMLAMMPNLMSMLGFGFYGLVGIGGALILVHMGKIGRRSPGDYIAATAQPAA